MRATTSGVSKYLWRMSALVTGVFPELLGAQQGKAQEMLFIVEFPATNEISCVVGSFVANGVES